MSDKINFESLLTAETNISVYEFSDELDGIEITYSDASQQILNGNLVLLYYYDQFYYPFFLSPSSKAIVWVNDNRSVSLSSPIDSDYLSVQETQK